MNKKDMLVISIIAIVIIAVSMYFVTSKEIPPPLTGFLEATTSPVLGHIYVNGSYNIGNITLELENGTYTITYGDVSDYITPISQTVEIFEDFTTTVEGIYVKEEISRIY